MHPVGLTGWPSGSVAEAAASDGSGGGCLDGDRNEALERGRARFDGNFSGGDTREQACMALEISQPFALGASELPEAANIDRLEADGSTDTPRQKIITYRHIVFEVERIPKESVGCTGIGD